MITIFFVTTMPLFHLLLLRIRKSFRIPEFSYNSLKLSYAKIQNKMINNTLPIFLISEFFSGSLPLQKVSNTLLQTYYNRSSNYNCLFLFWDNFLQFLLSLLLILNSINPSVSYVADYLEGNKKYCRYSWC